MVSSRTSNTNLKMKIKVYGAGTWGIALAELLVQNEHQISVWHYKNTFLNDLKKNLIHILRKNLQ